MKQPCPALMPYQKELVKASKTILVDFSPAVFMHQSSRRKTPCVISSTASEGEITEELTNTLKHSGFLVIDEYELLTCQSMDCINNWMPESQEDVDSLRSAHTSLHGDDNQLGPFLGKGKISLGTFIDGKSVLIDEFHTDNLPWNRRKKGEGKNPGFLKGKHRGGRA